MHPSMTKSSQNKNLLDAARDGNLAELKLALKNGADVNAVLSGDRLQLFPLLLAAYNGQTDCLKHLLTIKEVKINQTCSHNNTALISTTLLNQTDCLKILIKANADIECINNSSQTAVTQATTFDCLDSVEILIKAGANTNKLNDEYKLKCTDLIDAVKGKKNKISIHHRNISKLQNSLQSKKPVKPKRRQRPKL